MKLLRRRVLDMVVKDAYWAATLPRSTWHSTQPDIDEPAVRSAYEWILAQHGLF